MLLDFLYYDVLEAPAEAEPWHELDLAQTWSAVCCHVTVTGAVAIIAAVDAAVLVIGTRIWPVVWQPQLV